MSEGEVAALLVFGFFVVLPAAIVLIVMVFR
jgi:hypothetical protein